MKPTGSVYFCLEDKLEKPILSIPIKLQPFTYRAWTILYTRTPMAFYYMFFHHNSYFILILFPYPNLIKWLLQNFAHELAYPKSCSHLMAMNRLERMNFPSRSNWYEGRLWQICPETIVFVKMCTHIMQDFITCYVCVHWGCSRWSIVWYGAGAF